jgi:hypothetical protein
MLTLPFFFQENPITGMATLEITGNTYYVDSENGLDSNDGLTPNNPIRTITKVNTLNLNPGDGVLFKKGGVWRFSEDAYLKIKSGSNTGYIIYSSYGTGEKPLFLASHNLSSENNWSNYGTNLWRSSGSLNIEIGNIIFSKEELTGRRMSEFSNLITNSIQDYFWYNSTGKFIVMYSSINPAQIHNKGIEAAEHKIILTVSDKSYVIIEDIGFMYSAFGGIGGNTGIDHHIIVNNCTVKWIGGGYLNGDPSDRTGNGISFSLNVHNITVINNNVSQVWDSCIAITAWNTAGSKTIGDINYSYNLLDKCAYGFEYFSSHADSTTQKIYITHNTITNSGYGWSNINTQGGDRGRGMRLASTPTSTSYFIVKDNIIWNSNYIIYDFSINNAWKGNLEMNNNLYHIYTNHFANWNGTTYSALSNMQSAQTYENNGLESNPLFELESYQPSSDSPACFMSSTGSYVGALPCAGSEPEPFCGDDSCNGDENCSTCESDCGICPPPPNNPPTQSTPILNASDNPINSTNATLNCYNQSSTDEDDDSITNNYRWFRNSSLRSGLTTNTLNSDETTVGDEWVCEITPYDGINYGTAMNSSTLIILPACGDGSCNGLENCSTCESDCGICPPPPICGDNICNGEENCLSCSNDCEICSINSCELEDKTWNEDESLNNAYNLNECFNDPLNNTIYYSVTGNNSINISIINGIVSLSQPADWNGAEEIIFIATNNESSNQTNSITLTVSPMADCGDGSCNGLENCSTCESDCGECIIEPFCGDLVCNGLESCTNCVSDCGNCPRPASSGGGGGGGGSSAKDKETDWICAEWSECLNGKQTQECTHITKPATKTNTRNCIENITEQENIKTIVDKEKGETTTSAITPIKEANIENPELIESGTKPSEEQTPGTIKYVGKNNTTATITYGVIAAIIMGIFIYGMNKGKKPKNDSEDDYAIKLNNYIKEASNRGYPKEKIKNELKQAGWGESMVESMLFSYQPKTDEYIEETEENDSSESKNLF